VWSHVDCAVLGSYHKLSSKHLLAYLDEFAFRFKNRNNPFLFCELTGNPVEDALTAPEYAAYLGEIKG